MRVLRHAFVLGSLAAGIAHCAAAISSRAYTLDRQDCGLNMQLSFSGNCVSVAPSHQAASPRAAELHCAANAPAGAGVLRIHTQNDLDSLTLQVSSLFSAEIANNQLHKLWTGLVYIPGAERSYSASPANLQPKQQAGQWFWLNRSPANFPFSPPGNVLEAMEQAVAQGLHCMSLQYNSGDGKYYFAGTACDDSTTHTACSWSRHATFDQAEYTVLTSVGTFSAADSLCRQHGSTLVSLNTESELSVVSQLITAPEQAWTGAKKVPVHAGTDTEDYYWAAGHAWGAHGDMLDFNARHTGDCVVAQDSGAGFRLKDWPCTPSFPGAVPTHAVCMYDPAEMDFMQCPFGYLRWSGSCYSMNRARSLGRPLEFFQEECSHDAFAYPLTLKSEEEVDWILSRFFVPLANSTSVKSIVLGRLFGKFRLESPVESAWMWIDGDLSENSGDVVQGLGLSVVELSVNLHSAILQFQDSHQQYSETNILDRSAVRVFAPDKNSHGAAFQSASTICKLPVRAANKCSRGWIPLANKCYAVSDAAVERMNADVTCNVLGGVLSDGGVSLERALLMPTLRGALGDATAAWAAVEMVISPGSHDVRSDLQPSGYKTVEMELVGYPSPALVSPALGPLAATAQLVTDPETLHSWSGVDPSDKLPALCVRYEAVSCPSGPLPSFGTLPLEVSRLIPYGWVLHKESW